MKGLFISYILVSFLDAANLNIVCLGWSVGVCSFFVLKYFIVGLAM